jgi:hypothetical protein
LLSCLISFQSYLILEIETPSNEYKKLKLTFIRNPKMKTKQCSDLKPGIRTIQEIFEGAKSNPKNCRSVINNLKNLTNKEKLKLLKAHPVWIVHIFDNGTISKEEMLYYGLAKQAEPNQTIENGIWIVEGITINHNGGDCYAYSGAVVNLSGGYCYTNSNVVVNQSGGYCIANSNVVVNQNGGDCDAFSGAVVNQSRGYCNAFSSAVINQSGGYCHARSGAVAHQSGGYCIAYPDVVVNQSGGYCYAYLGSVVNQSGNGGTINRT